MDRAWWGKYGNEVKTVCGSSRATRAPGVKDVEQIRWDLSNNSGAGAILLAAYWGASSIILLGYDVQLTGGMSHWHGDHPDELGNAGSLKFWPAQFDGVAARLVNTPIVNCSRHTSLSVFPRLPLEICLSE